MTVSLLGIPFDGHSSFLRGCAQAPPRIRAALRSPASNLMSERGIDLGAEPRFRDAGDLALPPDAGAFEAIEAGVLARLERGERVLSLGGDHSITYAIVRAFARRYRGLTILQLDAHPDLYDVFEGDRYSHACPFARIMEEGLAGRLIQAGIRTLNPHQQAQALRFAVQIVHAADWDAQMPPAIGGPVYLSLDLDVLDPAFAPGVSHHEPGGVTTRQVLELVKALDVPIVGADIVEYNPTRDPGGVTAAVAAKCVKEVAACLLETP